ncbi:MULTISPECIES: type II toxin-antitoxin system HicA family toxin [Legionella]|uniref:type II toxin-antitoxin system HicA family toxin n=1 Tax=Legionella TaxID=445 RepID=UPI000F8E2351|nr:MULTISPECIES: type II toxin-antitoxin system HicA family toxin [Legionella]MCP0914980.1 type II toxin-antitoxin system HicA family toxin [Legionella sp. 27cVA30]RUQ92763.1 type II toxin-antitoxin system HicA family toxin [Legionella septentrionalis]RUR10005.1 type II toxin-antitoxin system HicA family toxin [Legionella septentrionalis]
MTKKDKLRERILSSPSDFTWAELTSLLNSLGYKESNAGKTSGSRVRFISDKYSPITLHKPHPKPILKKYMVKQVIQQLQKEGLL